MKAILFDACDILYHRPDYNRRMTEFLGPQWLTVRRENKAQFKAVQKQAARGEIPVGEMFTKMLELYGLPPAAHEDGARIMAEIMDDVEYFDGVCETLHQLKSDGFKLAIITNSFQSTKTKLDWFAKVGIDQIWDAFVSSSETGLLKPEPAIFLEGLARLECEPGDSAYVAHSAKELAGAKSTGMISIAFNRDDDTVQADYIIDRFSELTELAKRLQKQAQTGS